MPSSDGSDANATIDKTRRSIAGSSDSIPGAPLVRAPGTRRSQAFAETEAIASASPDRALTVVDGDGDEEERDGGVTIDPTTASTLGDFGAAMVGPVAAAVYAGSLAVFIGTALLVLLIRAQGRRSALTDSEISAISPLAAGIGAAALTYAVLPTSGIHAISAGLVALAAGSAAALLLRLIVDRFVHTRVAVLGDAAIAHDLAWQLSASGQRRFTIVGYVTRTSERDNLRDLSHVSFKVRRLGLLTDLSHIVARNDIDLLVMAAHDDRMKYFERAAVCTERYRTRLLSLTAYEEAVFRRVPLDHLNVAWFQHIMHPRFRPAPRIVTRAVDIVLALSVGLLTLPIWAPTALFMRLAFGRPVLVSRRRVGERGRAIGLWRFRVARRDVTGAPPEEDAPAVGFGRVLRRTGIERLPVLINLLRGDVTLVGPRPVHPRDLAEREREIPFYGRRQMLRPGLTGWAQIHHEDSPADEFSSDLFYLKHQSLMLYTYVLLASAGRPLSRSSR